MSRARLLFINVFLCVPFLILASIITSIANTFLFFWFFVFIFCFFNFYLLDFFLLDLFMINAFFFFWNNSNSIKNAKEKVSFNSELSYLWRIHSFKDFDKSCVDKLDCILFFLLPCRWIIRLEGKKLEQELNALFILHELIEEWRKVTKTPKFLNELSPLVDFFFIRPRGNWIFYNLNYCLNTFHLFKGVKDGEVRSVI